MKTLIYTSLVALVLNGCSIPRGATYDDVEKNSVQCLSESCEGMEGILLYSDGSRYAGELKFGLPHGFGVRVWPNGDKYSGGFKFGEKHGQGVSVVQGRRSEKLWYLGKDAVLAEQRRVARSYQQNRNKGGFQWGKFAALATGAVVGGLGNLDAQSQTNIIGGMMMDSMEGQKGMSNTRNMTDLSSQQREQRRIDKQRVEQLYQQANSAPVASNSEYAKGVARSAAYKKQLEQGVRNNSSEHNNSAGKGSLGSVKTSSTQVNSVSESVSNPQVSEETPQSSPNIKPIAPRLWCFMPSLFVFNGDYASRCPAFDKCMFDAAPWVKDADRSLGWKAKRTDRLVWKNCKSLELACDDSIRRKEWGEDYDACMAERNNASHDYSRKGQSM